MCKHPAGLVQGVGGPPAPVVKFLLDMPATLIESIPGQVHDVEGIHNCPCIGELFSGCALKPGESIHRDDLNALAPRVGREASQVVKTCLDRPGIISKSREGPLRSRMGVTPKITVTYLSPYGVCRHTCSSTPMMYAPSKRSGSSMSMRWPSPKIAVLAALPGHTEGLGDARHRQLVDHQVHQHPTHRRTRELRAWIGRCTHVLTPHVSTRLGSGSDARSRARSWDATHMARAPSA